MSTISKTITFAFLAMLQMFNCVSAKHGSVFKKCKEFKNRWSKYQKVQNDEELLEFIELGDFVSVKVNGVHLAGYVLSRPVEEDTNSYEIRVLEGNRRSGKAMTVLSERPRFLNLLNIENDFSHLTGLKGIYSSLATSFDNVDDMEEKRLGRAGTEMFQTNHKWIFSFDKSTWIETQEFMKRRKDTDLMIGDCVVGFYNGYYLRGFITAIIDPTEYLSEKQLDYFGRATQYSVQTDTKTQLCFQTTNLVLSVPDAKQFARMEKTPRKYHHSVKDVDDVEKARKQFKIRYRFCKYNY